MIYFGELAALGTACCWSFGSFFFDAAGRQIGAVRVNTIRIPLAAIFLSIALWVATGHPLPTSIAPTSLFWLATSGFVGLVLGDMCFFTSLVILGPRRATVIMLAAPVFAALSAWPMLGETLRSTEIVGILIVLAGIAWVSVEKRSSRGIKRTGSVLSGVFWGLGGAAGQGIGLVLAKLGMGDDVPALDATFYRMASAAILVWIITIASGRTGDVFKALANRAGIIFSACGAFIGPFLGVWLSLVAVLHTETGIAATLMATVPVLVIPLEFIVYREIPTFRGIFGILVALGGVAILFFR